MSGTDNNKDVMEEELLAEAERAYNKAVESGEVAPPDDLNDMKNAASENDTSDDVVEETSDESESFEESTGKEDVEFVRGSTDMTAVCSALGLCLGAVLGFLVSNIAICITCGVVLGLIIGLALDYAKDKKSSAENAPEKSNEQDQKE